MKRICILLTLCMLAFNVFSIEKIETNGFISQGFIYSKYNNYLVHSIGGSFEFNETAINFRTHIDERLTVGIQLLSRDLGDQGNNQIKLDWGFADYQINNKTGMRIGKFKSPPGFYNVIRDVDLLRNEVFLPQAVYDESSREFFNSMTGLDFYFNQYTDKGDFELELVSGVSSFDENSAYLRNMASEFSEAGIEMSNQTLDIYSDNGFAFTYTFPNTNLSFKYANYRINGQVNANVDASNYYTAALAQTASLVGAGAITAAQKTALDAQALANKNTLESGIQNFDVNVDRWYIYGFKYQKNRFGFCHERKKMDAFVDIPVLNITEGLLDLGYYSKIEYVLDKKTNIFLFSSTYYANEEKKEMNNGFNPFHRGYQKDNCLGLRYNIDDSTTAKFEYHDVEGTAQVYTYLNDTLTKDWSYIALKVTVSF